MPASNTISAAGYVIVGLPFALGGSGTYTAVGGENASTGKMLQGLVSAVGLSVFNYDGTFPRSSNTSLIVTGFYRSAS